MSYLIDIAIWIIHKIEDYPKEYISFELGHDLLAAEEKGEMKIIALIEFTIAHLDWHAKIDTGWVPPEYQDGQYLCGHEYHI